ncbi:GNAT family N-acetyltransferase [Nocardioides sp. GXZ039]|uniref:GNAT family N-acetyltransferase n=1 Tax=Nocardioides sp. GXZ039 TaxID=3136018 RepID=UPI0030F3CE4F
MAETEVRVEAGAPRIARVEYGDPDALALIAQVQEEYVRRYGGPDRTPLDPAMFDPPVGSFFVAYADSTPLATGAWRRRDDVVAFGSAVTAEIKRMYVVPDARGRGLARAVLAHLESTAASSGAVVMVLETGVAQPEAIALYESSGYTAIEPFGHYRHSPLNRCYGKDLRCCSR